MNSFKIALAAVLITGVGSAALAKPYRASGTDSYAMQLNTSSGLTPGEQANTRAFDPYVVIRDGGVIGRDPDPNIRTQILRHLTPDEYN
jgi:hypothetical protein